MRKRKLTKIGHYYGYELFIDTTCPLEDSSFPISIIENMAEHFISNAHKTNEVLQEFKELIK